MTYEEEELFRRLKSRFGLENATLLLQKFEEDHKGCWIWTLKPTPQGYAHVEVQRGRYTAHRLFYETVRGEVKKPLVLDHLCRVRNCVRPSHLEPVTSKENVLRGVGPSAQRARMILCSKGHEFSWVNLPNGSTRRVCKKCRKERASQLKACEWCGLVSTAGNYPTHKRLRCKMKPK